MQLRILSLVLSFQKYSLAESFTESRRQRFESSVEESSGSTTSTASGLDRLKGSRHVEGVSPPRVRVSETTILSRTATSSESSGGNGSTRHHYASDEIEGPDYGRYNTSGLDTVFFLITFKLRTSVLYNFLNIFLELPNFKIRNKNESDVLIQLYV